MRAWALPLAQAASLAAGPSAGSRGTSLRVISSRDSSGESEALAYRVPSTVPGAAALGGYASRDLISETRRAFFCYNFKSWLSYTILS